MTETTTVTVLFCDLVGSTRIISEVGDDAADRLRHRMSEALRAVVVARRGNEVKTLGDGMRSPSRARRTRCLARSVCNELRIVSTVVPPRSRSSSGSG